jgi:membrane fusion protein, multidrug efflux system
MPADKNKPRSKFKLLAWLVALAVIIIGFLAYWHYTKYHPSTDDAYIQAHIVHIAPQASGPVSAIFVSNYEHIKKGQKLFNIDPAPFQIAVASSKAALRIAIQNMNSAVAGIQTAQAAVVERQSELELAEKNAKRMLVLVKKGQLSKQEGDKVNNALHVAQAALTAAKNTLAERKAALGTQGDQNAEIKAAQANLAKAKLSLSYATVTAPNGGQLINFKTRTGDMLTAGRPLFDIVEDGQWWVMANFKETALERIRPGQRATITTDMYPNHTFIGRVYRVSPGSGAAFSILPPENATGNWVKVTQRFPVKILITHLSKAFPLRMGASADVTINTVATS